MGAIAAASIGILGGVGALVGYGVAEAHIPRPREVNQAEQNLQDARAALDTLAPPESCQAHVIKMLGTITASVQTDKAAMSGYFSTVCGDTLRSTEDPFIVRLHDSLSGVTAQQRRVGSMKAHVESAGLIKTIGGLGGGFGGLIFIPVAVTIHERRKFPED